MKTKKAEKIIIIPNYFDLLQRHLWYMKPKDTTIFYYKNNEWKQFKKEWDYKTENGRKSITEDVSYLKKVPLDNLYPLILIVSRDSINDHIYYRLYNDAYGIIEYSINSTFYLKNAEQARMQWVLNTAFIIDEEEKRTLQSRMVKISKKHFKQTPKINEQKLSRINKGTRKPR